MLFSYFSELQSRSDGWPLVYSTRAAIYIGRLHPVHGEQYSHNLLICSLRIIFDHQNWYIATIHIGRLHPVHDMIWFCSSRQRTLANGLSSYHKFLHKSWSNFVFRISTKHQLQNLNQTSAFRLNLNFKILTKTSFRITTKIKLHNLNQASP